MRVGGRACGGGLFYKQEWVGGWVLGERSERSSVAYVQPIVERKEGGR